VDEAVLVQKVNSSHSLNKEVKSLIFREVLFFVADYEK
jgi:hypothetical protein